VNHALALLSLAGCGRIGFDELPGADAPASGPAIVQLTQATFTGSSSALTLMPTRAHDLLVVITDNVLTGTPLDTISDDANDAYVSSGMVAQRMPPPSVLELWYVPDSQAGAQTLTITDQGSVNREIWFLELEGMDHVAPLELVQTLSHATETGMPAAPPITPSALPALIVAGIAVPGTVMTVAAPFEELPIIRGDDAAYAITEAAGTFTAAWRIGATGEYSALAAAFRATP